MRTTIKALSLASVSLVVMTACRTTSKGQSASQPVAADSVGDCYSLAANGTAALGDPNSVAPVQANPVVTSPVQTNGGYTTASNSYGYSSNYSSSSYGNNTYGNNSSGYGNGGGGVHVNVNVFGIGVNVNVGHGNTSVFVGGVGYGNSGYGSSGYANGSTTVGGQCTEGNEGSVSGGIPVLTPVGGKGIETLPVAEPVPAQIPTQVPPAGKTPCGQNPTYTPVTGQATYPVAQPVGNAACGQNGIYCDNGSATPTWPTASISGQAFDQSVVTSCMQAFRNNGYNTAGAWGIDVRSVGAAAAGTAAIQDNGTAQSLVILNASDGVSGTYYTLLDSHALYCIQGVDSMANITVQSCYGGNVAWGAAPQVLSSGLSVQACSN